MLTWEQENAAPIGTYDDELHDKIGTFPLGLEQGKEQGHPCGLEEQGQQKPGIVSLDGA